MNQHLQTIFNFIQQSEHISAEEKAVLAKAAKSADKELEIILFKLDRTEKVKRTTAILLEETIEELEQKRKAVEVQNRELEIESALERVRTVAMSMSKPDDLLSICEILYNELQKSGFNELRNAMINIHNDVKDFFLNYDYASYTGKTITTIFYNSHPVVESHIRQIKSTQDAFAEIVVAGKELDDWRKFRKENGEQDDPVLDSTPSVYYYFYSVGTGDIGISTYHSIANEELDVLKKFRNVFDLAYKRYTDITKAEAQSRESQIQLALERVRARTMAMQKSNELADTASVLFQQIKELGFETWSCGFCIWTKNDLAEVWMAAGSGGLLPPMMIPYKEEPTHAEIYKASLRGELAHNKIWEGKELEKHYAFLKTIPSVKNAIDILEKSGLTLPSKQCYYVGFFKEGYLLLITKEPNEGLKDLSKRFASVFDLTYTRFLDLQKAEAQAKESQIEAALERVRSRTLAMQKADELAETSAVLFKQLIGLGISPNRLYISIIKDDEGETEFWITDEDASKVSMAYADNLNNNLSFKKMYDGWKAQKISLVIDMKGEDLTHYFDYLNSIHVPFKGGLVQKRRLQYIAYFSKGFIGMASPDEQPAETIQLLERFAYVFNLTFTRFHDLQMAEAHAVQAEEDLIKLQTEKRRAEDTLTELKETQKQLVQAEKMASLGELTAGIAHEIQNPLNFVNNFSEVNKEMIEEAAEEMEKGNYDDAKHILNDIKGNEEKINHHGRRADAIVKGMLQHSRKNSGIKEPTDINKLADEYLRLNYHGLRAKDKNFNADFKTDFDESIGKINIVPQDIGRVLLNLFNNAFYAVNEKKKQSDPSYKPIVSVQTKRIKDKIEIVVEDNGSGIPHAIIDKIFQPFFTTKPTGQGTGLGLSLAYDIITKEHGGTIKAESKQDEGTTFTIRIPIS